MHEQKLCPDCQQRMPRVVSAATTIRYICQACFDWRLLRGKEERKAQHTPDDHQATAGI